MNIFSRAILWAIVWSFLSCIGDDIIDDRVDPVLRITNAIDTMEINTNYTFEALFLNHVGKEEVITLEWNTSDPDLMRIDPDGNATALAVGVVRIGVKGIAPSGEAVQDEVPCVIGNSTVNNLKERKAIVKTTSSYLLEGDAVLQEMEGGFLKLSLAENYKASTALPGLYVYLTNNPNTTAGAYEIGAVSVFSGAHDYELPSEVKLTDYDYLLYYCKPFNVKVGDGKFED